VTVNTADGTATDVAEELATAKAELVVVKSERDNYEHRYHQLQGQVDDLVRRLSGMQDIWDGCELVLQRFERLTSPA
jgi:hypothetical protein